VSAFSAAGAAAAPAPAWRARLRPALRDGSVGAILTTGAGGVLALAVNVATGLIAARMLGVEGRGEFAALALWPHLLGHCLVLGLPAALVYHLGRAPADAAALLAAGVGLAALAGAAAAALGVALTPLLLAGYDAEVLAFARWAMLAAAPVPAGYVLVAFLQAAGAFGQLNAARLAGPLATLPCLLALGLLAQGAPTSREVAALYLACNLLLPPAWALAAVLRRARPRLERPREMAARLLPYGLRYAGAELAGTLGAFADRAVVASVLGPVATGHYVVAQSAARVLGAISGAVATVIFPKASGLAPAAALRLVRRGALLCAGATALAAVPLAALGPWLLEAAYGAGFGEAGPAFRLLVAEAVVASFAAVMLQGLLATGRPGAATLAQVAGLAVALPMIAALAWPWGIEGVALAVLAAAAARSLLLVLLSSSRPTAAPATCAAASTRSAGRRGSPTGSWSSCARATPNRRRWPGRPPWRRAPRPSTPSRSQHRARWPP
jgi:O-antigen/teichoic acid export membrane protein